MKNKQRDKTKKSGIFIFGIILLILVVGLVMVIAESGQSDLESELSNLSSGLVEDGYGWLVNCDTIKFIGAERW